MNHTRQRREMTLIADDDGDTLIGGMFDDTLIGGAGRDIIKGRRGDDIIVGNGGKNKVKGGRGADEFGLCMDGRMVIKDYNSEEGDVITLPLYKDYGVMEWELKRNRWVLYIEDQQVAKFNSPFHPNDAVIVILD